MWYNSPTMARQKELNINTPLKEVTLVGLLLVIPRILIAIGDAMRFVVSLIFHVLATIIITTGIVIRDVVRAISRPKKKKIVKLPSVKIPAFRWPVMPTIQVPRFHLPKFSAPKIRFPKFKNGLNGFLLRR